MIDETWYALEFYPGDLFTISFDGTMTRIGGNGTAGDAIAYSDVTQTLYCADLTSLYSIDIATGNGTYIGPIGNTSIIIAMACDRDGNLFGADMVDDQLYSIDAETRAGTVIGPLGVNINFAQDMEFDKDAGICYLAAIGHGLPGRLMTINTTTGAAALVGHFPGGMEISALAIPYGQAGDPGWIRY